MLKIGILKEGKVPPDFRVALTPEQCSEIQKKYADKVEISVQSSSIRTFSDEDYIKQGIKVVSDVSDCDLLIGVKEVQLADLIANKTYLFFSHTIKEQPHNRKLLQTILAKKISLIDYEVIKDENKKRLIGFGKYAGIVGTYNGFRAYGLKTKKYELLKAVDTNSRKKIEQELSKVELPTNFKMVVTGFGRVGHGAREIIDLLPIKEVSKEDFLTKSFDEPVFVHLDTADYYSRKADNQFDKAEFYQKPQLYQSVLSNYLEDADMYVACHFWAEHSPFLVTKEDLKNKLHRLQVIADVSCDIGEPIESTIRSSSIANPIYGYNRETGQEDDFNKEGILAVMAVDNLPCELPKDASKDFGRELIDYVLPNLLKENNSIIENARITDSEGNLTTNFAFLSNYVLND
jgi:alanine dehydrogenase